MSFSRVQPQSTDVAKSAKGKKTAKAESQTLAAENAQRIALYVSNPSAKEVWLALGSTAVAKEGIWLKKEAGSVVIEGYTGIVTCITTEGEGEIAYAEI